MHTVDTDVVNINCSVFVLIQYIDYAILIRMEMLETKYIFSFTIWFNHKPFTQEILRNKWAGTRVQMRFSGVHTERSSCKFSQLDLVFHLACALGILSQFWYFMIILFRWSH